MPIGITLILIMGKVQDFDLRKHIIFPYRLYPSIQEETLFLVMFANLL